MNIMDMFGEGQSAKRPAVQPTQVTRCPGRPMGGHVKNPYAVKAPRRAWRNMKRMNAMMSLGYEAKVE